MLFAVVIIALALAEGSNVVASLKILPILRGNKLLRAGSPRALTGIGSSRDILDTLPQTSHPALITSQSDLPKMTHNDVTYDDIGSDVMNLGKTVLKQIKPINLHNNYDSAAVREDAVISSYVSKLLARLAARYQLDKLVLDSLRSGQQRVMGKRQQLFLGQRRMGRARIASFGTKLSQSRKNSLRGKGTRLLRYGRSTRQA